MEWNDAVISGSLRGMRGGCWIADESDMFSSLRGNGAPTYESGYMGFRVASLTEPLLGVAPQFTSTEPPPTGMVGTAYNHTCTASGTTPISFMVTAGALPGGLDLSSGGVIFGTPNTTGTFTGTITATNGILPNATQDFSIVIDTHEYRTLVATGSNGNVSGGGIYLLNATATLTPNPNPGYLFTGWTGDATGTDNPLSILMNSDKTITATFDPDTNDPDGDGLTNYQELVIYHSNPNVADTDGDGFDDGVEVSSGFNPNDFASRPDGQMVITTAVEVSFLSALGQNYRIESSMDLQTWTPVVDGVGVDGAGNIVSGGHVVGTGDTITLWYTIRNIPKRYFRTVRE
jgi:uncharacterized repeat protein (TIGR02543 family)